MEKKVEEKKSEVPEKYQTLVENQTIYSLLNSDALAENKVFKNCENVLNRQTMFYIGYDSVVLKKVDTLFTKKDKEFISKQYRNGVRFILDQKFLKHKKVIEYDTTMMAEKKSRIYWNKMLEKYHCIGMIHTPLFNLKKDLAIVEIGYNCGVLCGEGGTYIYRLNKYGKWELYLTIEKWIS
ncbi:hypothetical protein [Flavobacterium mekongense]|uniref:hypothetical protein n=1 Tax=Flavobacterium mekongense TaxID=3379707 RepID=UPI00399B53A4